MSRTASGPAFSIARWAATAAAGSRGAALRLKHDALVRKFRMLERGRHPEAVLLVGDNKGRCKGLRRRHAARGIDEQRLGAHERMKLLGMLRPRQGPKP